MAAKERFLEGKDASDLINPPAEFCHPPGCPGPKLGRDELQRRDSPLLGGAGEVKVHGWGINADPKIGLLRVEVGPSPAQQAVNLDGSEGTANSHRRVGNRVSMDDRAGRRHFRSADTLDDDVGTQLLEGPNKLSGMAVAADLGRCDKHSQWT